MQEVEDDDDEDEEEDDELGESEAGFVKLAMFAPLVTAFVVTPAKALDTVFVIVAADC